MTRRGFTLIELLVVISIIGILSSFAIVSLTSARMKARDALRKGDTAQLRTALTLYYDDNSRYPVCNAAAWDPTDPAFGTVVDPDMSALCYLGLTTELVTSVRPLMMSLPMDPMNKTNETVAQNAADGDDTYFYRYISDVTGSQYAIVYYLEDDQTVPKIPQVIRGF